jgi:hypothetical protein
LASYDGTIEIRMLCCRLGMKQSALDPVLSDLEHTDGIARSCSRTGEQEIKRIQKAVDLVEEINRSSP